MTALLAAVVVPGAPVSSYGDFLLSHLGTIVVAVFPYAAGITAFAIGVGMVRRWLGHSTATSMAGYRETGNFTADMDRYKQGRIESRSMNKYEYKSYSQRQRRGYY